MSGMNGIDPVYNMRQNRAENKSRADERYGEYGNRRDYSEPGEKKVCLFPNYHSGKNPCRLLQEAVRQVDDLFISLTDKFNIDFSEFDTFLRNDEPEIEKNLSSLWNRIDVDIYDRYLTGRLSANEFDRWLFDLEKWKKTIESAIRFFALKKFGQILDRPVSMLFFDIAA
jgi:hypothetical protein